MNDAMIIVRAVHFAAVIAVTGVAFFLAFIADPAPAFGPAGNNASLRAMLRLRLAAIAWIGLALAVASGAAWLVVTAAEMSGRPLADVFPQGILWIVLLHTGFGRDWLARAALAGLLAAAFVPLMSPSRGKSTSIKGAAAVSAAGFAGSLAWAGHAVGATGIQGIVHPAADVLHLIAAAAWVGALVPFALLLAAAECDTALLAIARSATARFSTLGIASVATLLVTGSVNTYYLAGSVAALTETDYGRLLLAKVALFFVMVATAAVNRLRLRPQLAADATGSIKHAALRELRRNTMIEVVIGMAIIAIVVMLGITPPGLHEQNYELRITELR